MRSYRKLLLLYLPMRSMPGHGLSGTYTGKGVGELSGPIIGHLSMLRFYTIQVHLDKVERVAWKTDIGGSR